MRRRTALALATSLLSGCTAFRSDQPGTTDPSSARPTTTPTGTTTATPTASETAEPTDTPESTDTDSSETPTNDGPPPELIPANPASATAAEIRNHMEGVACDGLSQLPVVCGEGDERIELSLSQSVGSLPNDTVEFTVRNRADERFQWNEYGWRLQKWDGSEWRWIAPTVVPVPLHRIEPGASHTYRITADNTTFYGTEFYTERSDVTLSGLGPGVYGFSVDGYFDSTPDDEFEVGTVFGLAGEGPPVRPTDTVTDVARRGDEVIVRTGATERREVLVVTLVEDASADVTLLPEHVRQTAGLRSALAYAATEGVRSIRYLGGQGAAGTASSYVDRVTPEGTERYGFRDYVFEVTTEAV